MRFHTVLPGSIALNDQEAAGLLARLRQAEPGLSGVFARWFYLVGAEQPFQGDALARLQALVDDDPHPRPLAADGSDAASVYVTARMGTTSPWASKATDIAHNCGMTAVSRIERGIHYRLAWRGGLLGRGRPAGEDRLAALAALLHDRMTESWFSSLPDPARLFRPLESPPLARVPLAALGRDALVAADREYGLALSDDEIDYLVAAYRTLRRDPTDVELMMFAQANSEHCRHKIFNARFSLDGAEQPRSLFGMIRATHEAHPAGTAVAYADNAAILTGTRTATWAPRQRPVHLARA